MLYWNLCDLSKKYTLQTSGIHFTAFGQAKPHSMKMNKIVNKICRWFNCTVVSKPLSRKATVLPTI